MQLINEELKTFECIERIKSLLNILKIRFLYTILLTFVIILIHSLSCARTYDLIFSISFLTILNVLNIQKLSTENYLKIQNFQTQNFQEFSILNDIFEVIQDFNMINYF